MIINFSLFPPPPLPPEEKKNTWNYNQRDAVLITHSLSCCKWACNILSLVLASFMERPLWKCQEIPPSSPYKNTIVRFWDATKTSSEGLGRQSFSRPFFCYQTLEIAHSQCNHPRLISSNPRSHSSSSRIADLHNYSLYCVHRRI